MSESHFADYILPTTKLRTAIIVKYKLASQTLHNGLERVSRQCQSLNIKFGQNPTLASTIPGIIEENTSTKPDGENKWAEFGLYSPPYAYVTSSLLWQPFVSTKEKLDVASPATLCAFLSTVTR